MNTCAHKLSTCMAFSYHAEIPHAVSTVFSESIYDHKLSNDIFFCPHSDSTCKLKKISCENLWLQIMNLCAFFPSWADSTCQFNETVCKNVWLQSMHLYDSHHLQILNIVSMYPFFNPFLSNWNYKITHIVFCPHEQFPRVFSRSIFLKSYNHKSNIYVVPFFWSDFTCLFKWSLCKQLYIHTEQLYGFSFWHV